MRRVGAFEAADGGTLFLDEIGELPLTMQAALLRAIEYGEVRRVAARLRRLPSTFALSQRQTVTSMRRLRLGRFREDLLHRLNVIVLRTTRFANGARISGSWPHISLKSFRRQEER